MSSLQGYAFWLSITIQTFAFANVFGADYFARIETDSGTFLDRGKTNAGVALQQCCFAESPLQTDIQSFQEHFFSDLTEPEPELPTTKEQCEDGGFEDFAFKNQGDCVSFVETGGKNEPGKNQPNTKKGGAVRRNERVHHPLGTSWGGVKSRPTPPGRSVYAPALLYAV